MPYGVTGGPSTFQGTMNIVLAPLLRHGVLVFIDDILVYSSTLSAHIKLLRQVFELLEQHQLHLKMSKCSFAQKQLTYLGHVISAQGVATDEKNTMAVRNWPTPTTVREVRGFLGLAGYYRWFVRNFGIISRPLTNLLKKNTVFVWTKETDAAFQHLKSALCSAPVLALPRFDRPFELETDASDFGIGVVLMQDGHPLAFFSKHLQPKQRGLSTYEKEFMAILAAVDQWGPYLQHGEFVTRTDQKSLTHLNDQCLTTQW